MDQSPSDPTVPVKWPAPDPDAAAALLGAVMHSQGLLVATNSRSWLSPWASVDLDVWRPQIERALERGSLNFDEVKRGAKLGWFLPWSFGKAIMVTELIVSPRMRALHVFAAGGDLAEIREMVPMLEEFARRIGCTLTGASGRKGWVRALKRHGYAPAALHTVEKEL